MLDKFNSAVKRWWDDLTRLIDEASGAKLHLIAISRKMPRIFDWIEYEWLDSLPDADKEKAFSYMARIRKNGLLSEHAIPFILKSGSKEKCSDTVIVIDDIIITGSSMRDVIEDVRACSDTKPFISSIFIADSCSSDFDCSNKGDVNKIVKVPESELRTVIDMISERIKMTSLPLELEFPIFHLDDKYPSLSDNLKTEAGNLGCSYYSISHSAKYVSSDVENFSVILKDQMKWTLNHDYPKIRLFPHKGYIGLKENEGVSVLEASVPRVFSLNELESPDLFDEDSYREVWNIILSGCGANSIDKDSDPSGDSDSQTRMNRRRCLSLAVMANYLHSFSVTMQSCGDKKLLKSLPGDPVVDTKDLTLLVGADIASTLKEKLDAIAADRLAVPAGTERFFETEMTIAPGELSAEYKSYRYHSSLNSDSIDKSLRTLFQMQQDMFIKKMSAKGSFPENRFVIGETISALEELLKYPFNEDDKKDDKYVEELNRALDKGIDEGRISPFYAVVKDSSGIPCFRRFYRGGSSSLL